MFLIYLFLQPITIGGINAKSEILKRKRKVEGRGRGRERKRKGKKEEGKEGRELEVKLWQKREKIANAPTGTFFLSLPLPLPSTFRLRFKITIGFPEERELGNLWGSRLRCTLPFVENRLGLYSLMEVGGKNFLRSFFCL